MNVLTAVAAGAAYSAGAYDRSETSMTLARSAPAASTLCIAAGMQGASAADFSAVEAATQLVHDVPTDVLFR